MMREIIKDQRDWKTTGTSVDDTLAAEIFFHILEL